MHKNFPRGSHLEVSHAKGPELADSCAHALQRQSLLPRPWLLSIVVGRVLHASGHLSHQLVSVAFPCSLPHTQAV